MAPPFRVFWIWLLCLLPLANCAAETPDLLHAPVKEWQQQLDDAEARLKAGDFHDEEAVGLRDRLLLLDTRLREVGDAARERAGLITHDLDALGPPPKDGEAAEAPRLATRRKILLDQIAAQDAGAKESDLLLSRLSRILSEIKSLRRERLTARILTRSFGTLDLSNWRRTAPEWQAFAEGMVVPLKSLVAGGTGFSSWQRAFLGLGLLGLMILRWRLGERLRAGRLDATPPVLAKLMDAARYFGILMILPLGLLGLNALAGATLGQETGRLFDDLVWMTVGFLLSRAVTRVLLRPDQSRMRLLNLRDPVARTLSFVILLIIALLAGDQLLARWFIREDVSPELLATEQAVFCLLLTLPLLGLLAPSLWKGTASGFGLRLLRWMVMGLTLAIPLATLLGYVALARLLATHGVLTLALVFFVGALIHIKDQVIESTLLPDARVGQWLRQSMGFSDEDLDMLVFWWRGALRILLFLFGIACLLLLWSGDQKDLVVLGLEFLNGFRVGQISIQPMAILWGLLLFSVFLITTRLIQRSLDQRIFPRTRLDVGARHSIRSAVGYLGFSLATMVGISVMGIDLSSLAIIAGALSVGIGFGLQNIVNNFVSGLILLIERPIKTGDWVVVGEYQGHVRNISVRATEITTFDRASVFIPNSNLISGSVLNRTHTDRMGRVILPLKVDSRVDPERVKGLLLGIAAANPKIRKSPPPVVFYTALDEAGLALELVAMVHDVEEVKLVMSQLLIEVRRRFFEEAIGFGPKPDPKELHVTLDEVQMKDLIQRLKLEGAEKVS